MKQTPQAFENRGFPSSLPEFQRLFPDDAACATYLEKIRWEHGFECPHCGKMREPYRFVARPGVLRCKSCRRDVALTAGTVMQRTHTPLSTWFWGAYLVSSITPGISAIQFQRQLGLGRYETAFQILHKLRASMVRADHQLIGGARLSSHVEVDQTSIGGVGKGRQAQDQTMVVAAVEVCQKTAEDNETGRTRIERFAERLRLEVVPDGDITALCSFVNATVEPRTIVVTKANPRYVTLAELGYQHISVTRRSRPQEENYLSMVRLVFLNLKSWLRGTHHGVSAQHLQAYLNEFAFRFNHRMYPFNAFRSLLGLASENEAPTYAQLYSGDWKHTMTGSDAEQKLWTKN